jgi:hypothetical protein
VTVVDACRVYVTNLRSEKREVTAHDAEKRYESTVYKNDLGGRALAKLRTPHRKAWRDGRALGKAALNLAVAHRQVSPSAAIESAQVKPHKNAGKRRDLYLDLKQRRPLPLKCWWRV